MVNTHEMFGTTSTPCPPWCDDRPGHGYDGGDCTCFTRIHTRDLGDVIVDGHYLVSVSLHAAENAAWTADGMSIEVVPPMISVDSGGDDLTGPQAREAAAMLLAAADLWDEVTAEAEGGGR